MMRRRPSNLHRGFVFNATISSNRLTTYNLRTEAIAAGYDGVYPLYATVTINSGVYLVSTSNNSSYAFQVDAAIPEGSILSLIVGASAIISGRGGNGGTANVGGIGGIGGIGLLIQRTITITNNGTIAGGGGGGGGSAASLGLPQGGGGRPLGIGFNAGTLTAPGAGRTFSTSRGGDGGNLGQAGNASTGPAFFNRGGGAAGAAIVGVSLITWSPMGTILGSTSG
jgi:hypothetical protein